MRRPEISTAIVEIALTTQKRIPICAIRGICGPTVRAEVPGCGLAALRSSPARLSVGGGGRFGVLIAPGPACRSSCSRQCPLPHILHALRTVDCGLWTVDRGLWTPAPRAQPFDCAFAAPRLCTSSAPLPPHFSLRVFHKPLCTNHFQLSPFPHGAILLHVTAGTNATPFSRASTISPVAFHAYPTPPRFRSYSLVHNRTLPRNDRSMLPG
jgi:hypothetical protein